MPFRNGMTDEPARMEWNEERAFEPLFLKNRCGVQRLFIVD